MSWVRSLVSISLRWNLSYFDLGRMDLSLAGSSPRCCFMLAWLVLWWLSIIFWYIAYTSSTNMRVRVLFWNGRWRPSIGSNGADSIRNVCWRKRSFYGVLPWSRGPSFNSELKECGQPIGLLEVANLNSSPSEFRINQGIPTGIT